MGLGGYLTWTAAAREIVKASGVPKVFPFEQHGNLLKAIKTPIFENNPYILQEFDSKVLSVPMQLNNPNTNYCKKDTREKAVHRYDRHIIQQICEFYGIKNPELKCELYFSEPEEQFARNIIFNNNLSKEKFIVIEPQSNDEYTVNKKYPLEKWQYVTNSLIKKGYHLVQLGKNNKDQVLEGVVNLTGKTTFRQAAAIIKHSSLFLSSEGGLMHAANAVSTPSVIVITGFIHPNMTCYPENSNIWVGKEHGPCGMKVYCPDCAREVKAHDPEEIIESVVRKFNE